MYAFRGRTTVYVAPTRPLHHFFFLSFPTLRPEPLTLAEALIIPAGSWLQRTQIRPTESGLLVPLVRVSPLQALNLGLGIVEGFGVYGPGAYQKCRRVGTGTNHRPETVT